MIEKYSLLYGSPFNIYQSKQDLDELSKEASLASPTMQYLDGLRGKHDPKGLVVIVNGLGTGDHYGCNINGDYFPEKNLLAKQEEDEAVKNPGEHQGKKLKRYKTFKTGHVFRNHKNSDPKKSIGDILNAFFNKRMRRVEIPLVVEGNHADKIMKKQKKEKPIPVSMGCKVPFDICSICKNKASSRREYCDHLDKNMGEIHDDGRQNYAINTKPRFFDLSFVTIPADKTAYALKIIDMGKSADGANKHARNNTNTNFKEELQKAASGENCDEDEEDSDNEDKESDISKRIDAEADVKDVEKKLDREKLEKMDSDSVREVLRAYIGDKINLKEAEVQWTIATQLMGKTAAKIMCQKNVYFDNEMDKFAIDDLHKVANIDGSDTQKISRKLIRHIDNARPFHYLDKEAQKEVKPRAVPLPDLERIEGQGHESAKRGAMAFGATAMLGDLIQKLKAATGSSLDEIKATLSKNPGLIPILASLVGMAGAFSSQEGPDPRIGKNPTQSKHNFR